MGYDDFIKFLTFCLGAINKMKNSRYWSLWFLALITVILIFAPSFITAIKA